MTSFQITTAIALAPLVILPAFWCLIVFGLSHASGWQRLAATYATQLAPHGKRFVARSGKVGGVSYRNVLIVHLAPEGMFLAVFLLFRIGHKTLLIPWNAIHDEEAVKFLWYRAVRFQIGRPTIGRVELPTEILEAKRG